MEQLDLSQYCQWDNVTRHRAMCPTISFFCQIRAVKVFYLRLDIYLQVQFLWVLLLKASAVV